MLFERTSSMWHPLYMDFQCVEGSCCNHPSNLSDLATFMDLSYAMWLWSRPMPVHLAS